MGLFGGNSDISSAQSSAAINSSGWSVGGGKASGGNLATAAGFALPWYAWASVAVVALYWWRQKKRGK